MGVVVRRYIYRFAHTTYPYSSVLFFAAASLLFVHKKMFFVLLYMFRAF